MTIPLATYNPNWETEWEKINEELKRENAKPYSDEGQDRAQTLLTQLHDAFHAQFRTTGDYAEWTENNARQLAESYKVSYLDIPEFPRDASVESTRNRYSRFNGIVQIEAKINWGGAMPLAHPSAPEAFALELDEGETRTVETMQHSFAFPVFEQDGLVGAEKRTTPYSYIQETRKNGINICFFQLRPEAAPSPINCIEQLATELYTEKYGANALMKGGTFLMPEKLQFFIYIPPRVNGRESLVNAQMAWDAESGHFLNPKWNHIEAVPYVLRKQAAAEGLARDPDAPEQPGAGRMRSSRPRRDNG